jgi:hypothetical protein
MKSRIRPIEPVDYVNAGKPPIEPDTDGNIEEHADIRRSTGSSNPLYRVQNLYRNPATATLVGVTGIDESIAENNFAPLD